MQTLFVLALLPLATAFMPIRRLPGAAMAVHGPMHRVMVLTAQNGDGNEAAVKPAKEGDFDETEEIISELMKATNNRSEPELEAAIMKAMKAGMSAEMPQVRQARETYQEVVSGVSMNMRNRLMREAQSSGADETIDWNPGYTYLGIFAVVSVLVVLGGKGIFY